MYNIHPEASVGTRRRPTRRQVRQRSGKSLRNRSGWYQMMDSSRYSFAVTVTRVTRHA